MEAAAATATRNTKKKIHTNNEAKIFGRFKLFRIIDGHFSS